MLFATHLVAAALLGRWSRLSPLWVVVGAAVPDLVDKPLAIFGVVDLFHSVGHSGLLIVVAIPVALVSRTGRAAVIGWGSHLLLDAGHIIVNGRPNDALFLGWPLVVPADPLRLPPGMFFWHYLWTPSFFIEFLIWGALLVTLLGDWRAGRSLLGIGRDHDR
ncbi:MAG: metal-dependent hydrolase [Halobacteriales archaeon]|nr:metal-dependent hydrolase [Halobacteriales archaeon]